ncbi:MAG: alpha/beta hydrolase [Opitutaceae bacterium]|jgi:pimeloyl-ACP methyl ester carboxylesterase
MKFKMMAGGNDSGRGNDSMEWPARQAGFAAWGASFEWRGFAGYEGVIDGRACRIVVPSVAAEGNPWAWRPEFFDAFAEVDAQVVARGFYLVYLDVSDHYGCPKAIAHGDVLWREMTTQFGLAKTCAFIALSRGGLFAYNYAATFPERVACIYADNPVCDFKSWPAGWGEGPGSAADWTKCLAVYEFTVEQARSYGDNPVDRAEVIAKAGIPIFQVLGDADEVVPVSENGYLLRERFKAGGGTYREIIKPGARHHPHGLDDPTPVVEFIFGCGSESV